MTLTAKTYDNDVMETKKQLKKSASQLHIERGTGLDNDAFDDSFADQSDEEEMNF